MVYFNVCLKKLIFYKIYFYLLQAISIK